MSAQRDRFNPTGYAGVPIIGQPKPDYGIGLGFMIPDDPGVIQHLKDQVALMEVKKDKGEVVVIYGHPTVKMVRCFTVEAFLELIFGKPEVEHASGGKNPP